MAVTSQTYNGDGSSKTFTFTVPVLADSDIKIFIGGVETTDFTKSGSDITLGASVSAPPVGINNVEIRRSTNNDTIQSNFQSGSALRASDFNANFQQFQYVTQEAFNQADFALENSREGDAAVGFKSAITIANEAKASANAATSTISDISPYTTVGVIGNIPSSPANGDRIVISDSTGIETSSNLPAGTVVNNVPVGYVGESGLAVRLQYVTADGGWNWIEYYVSDPDSRYLRSISNYGVGQVGQYLSSDAQGFAFWEDFEVATTTTDGYMSSADKSKLDGIASGAEVNVQSDWSATTGDAFIANKPTLATIATSGLYSDITGAPNIPTFTSDLTNDSGFTTFDGDYNSLTNTPTIPAAQVQANWTETDTNLVSFIQNKPTIPAAQVQANWSETNTTSLAYILNKPNTITNSDKVATTGTIPTAQAYSIPFLSSTTGYVELYNVTGLTWNTSSTTLDVPGAIVATSDITAYSDARLKTNVSVIENALDKVSNINGVTYYRSDLQSAKRQTGLIAQELQKVLPEAVLETADGTLAVAYGNVVGLLVQAIKELRGEVEELKNGTSV